MNNIITRIALAISHFDARIRWFDAGRAVLAISQLTLLLTTPTTAMFVPVGPDAPLAKCDQPLRGLSAFCWAEPEPVRWIFVVLLLAIGAGLAPRYLAWVHWFIALSIGMVIDLPEGGEAILMSATFWIAIVSVADGRWFAWRKPSRPPSPMLNAIAWAALWGLRAQMSYVYINSALAKLPVEQWSDGTAMYYVVRMEFFGAVGPLGDVIRFLTSIPVITAALTWGTIAWELTLSVLVLGSTKMQRYALLASVALHLAIAVLLGLASFALAMIGAMTCATSTAWAYHRRSRAAVRPITSVERRGEEATKRNPSMSS